MNLSEKAKLRVKNLEGRNTSSIFSTARFDFSKTESQALAVHSVRFAFLLIVLLFTLSFRFLETRIDVGNFFYPLYVLLGISTFLQVTYLGFFKSLYRNVFITGFLFYFEAFYITSMIYFIGVQQSILIFLYLVNLILCGTLFQRKGALALALWTSILFSLMVSLDTSLSGNTAYLAVGVNNLAFFTVAYLAGFLSEQLNFMGEQLEEKVRDVRTLKNLNTLILKNIYSGLVTVDKDYRIVQANPASSSILGLVESQMIQSPVDQILPGLHFEKAQNQKGFDLVYKKGGEQRILSLHMSPLIDEQGREQGQIIHFQDETHLRTLEKRVRQSEKMAAIGQLAAGIAHEIRNPLAGISGSIQLMQADASDPDQTAKLMNIVSREIDRLNNLITEFLDFAKPEAPMEDAVEVGPLVQDILQFLKNDQEGSRIDIEFVGEKDVLVLGNRDKLKQAFLNILVNAFQATEGRDQPRVKTSVQSRGDRVEVRIADNGVGMSEELRQRIFEPFHTTKHKGTGLGLAVTHSIIEAHSAHIQVESEANVGTEFIIQFKKLSRD